MTPSPAPMSASVVGSGTGVGSVPLAEITSMVADFCFASISPGMQPKASSTGAVQLTKLTDSPM